MATDDTPAYGGASLIADTSAWTAIRRSKQLGNTPADWTAALYNGQLLTSPIVKLELLHSTSNAVDFEKLDDLLGWFREIEISPPVFRAAEWALRELAKIGENYHRVGVADALIAASAAERSVGVLHYNHKDFRRLARVLRFNVVELAPPGTFERS
ncbi:MAG: PIN domain-containing protein [Solirubrobacteraceae bacterium]